MKQLIVITISILLTASACKKERQNVTPEIKPTPDTVIVIINPPTQTDSCHKDTINLQHNNKLLGMWTFADNTGRWLTIDSMQNGRAVITFSFQIDSPLKNPVTLEYNYHLIQGRHYFETSVFYPDFYIYSDSTNGSIMEYEKSPDQGKFIPIIKVP